MVVQFTSKRKDALLSRDEAADFLGVKPQTLACWASTRRYGLPVVKVGRLAKYLLVDLEEFIARHRDTGETA